VQLSFSKQFIYTLALSVRNADLHWGGITTQWDDKKMYQWGG